MLKNYWYIHRPIQRTSSEVKQLALLMARFPSLMPSTNPKVLLGVAARAQIEITGKGYSCKIFACVVHTL